MNQVQVTGKVVLMTGGAGGLARALADLVLTRGGDVFLCDTNEEELKKVKATLEKKHPDRKIGVSILDVRKKADWENAWKSCVNNIGMPAVVVNIAGIKGEQNWEDVYDINLKGVHLGIETTVSNLYKRKGGPGGSSSTYPPPVGDMQGTCCHSFLCGIEACCHSSY
eukprot:TRINITY_DN31381_c0_g1_i1.p1 TRINITY_DN31381_c0_g1~~TRINITY_DN31381_c0_g1_i1.p1  ORF type:complete len:184 (+),score=38.89 TRINITY_DN31381_c0_g1_i1:52-552(+)